MSPAFEFIPFAIPLALALACVIPIIFMKD